MVTIIQKAKKLLDALNKLDAQYLTGYPKNIPRNVYVSRRAALRKRFEALKK